VRVASAGAAAAHVSERERRDGPPATFSGSRSARVGRPAKASHEAEGGQTSKSLLVAIPIQPKRATAVTVRRLDARESPEPAQGRDSVPQLRPDLEQTARESIRNPPSGLRAVNRGSNPCRGARFQNRASPPLSPFPCRHLGGSNVATSQTALRTGGATCPFAMTLFRCR